MTITAVRHARALMIGAGFSVLLAGIAASAQTPDAAVQAFAAATGDYAALHRRIERTLPPLEVTSNPEVIFQSIVNLAAAIRIERPVMRRGDFFSDELGVLLRVKAADALDASGYTPADVRATEHTGGGLDPSQLPLKVGEPFHWLYSSAMFPCVLNALPPLPPELQYRSVGTTLVLIDVHANLVLDLLPYFLADTELMIRE